ncbi:MAG: ABC transporter permease [Bryobacterales bacterium]|nr:ABC transporter permease [Bryobacterales bacterium]
MLTLVDDIRFGFRLLFSRPTFTLVAVLTLTLGISVATAMFGVLDSQFGRAFPGVAELGRLAELMTVASDGSLVRTSYLDFAEYRNQLRLVSGVAARADVMLAAGESDRARPLRAELVSGNYFDVLGVRPVVGNDFPTAGEVPGTPAVAVISHRYWRNEMQGTPEVIGATLFLNRRKFTVVGVAPPDFRGALAGVTTDVWVPLTMGIELGVLEKDTFRDPLMRNVYPFVRLAPGASLDQARSELTAAASGLTARDPIGHRGFSATLEPLWRARIHGRSSFLQPVLGLLAVSLLVLGIVCGNVANLLLGRSASRLQEFSIRMALGASGWRVARLLFVETLLLSLVGAVLALPLAMWMVDGLVLLLPRMARAEAMRFELDPRVLTAAVLLAVAAAILSSVAPLLFVLRSGIPDSLRLGGRSGRAGARSHGLRTALVISEVAVAQLVLVGAGLTFQSYRNAAETGTGFTADGVLLADFSVVAGGRSEDEMQAFCGRLRDRVVPSTSITAAAYADYAPLWSTDGAYNTVRPEGFLAANPSDLKVHRTSVSPGYFALLEIPLLEGRDFVESDTKQAAEVMIVDQAFARRFYGGASPVGRRVALGKKTVTIVGLVRDSRYFSFTEGPRPHFYRPFRQAYQTGQRAIFFVKSSGDGESSVAELRDAARGIDPGLSGFAAAPLAEYNSLLLLPQKLAATLLNVLGLIALVLAGIGLYGVTSYAVSQRTQELGIRMALGARPIEVLGDIVGQVLRVTALGIVVGALLAVVVGRVLGSWLVGVGAFNVLAFVSSSLFLLLIATLATAIPAWRAMRVDPYTALRSD